MRTTGLECSTSSSHLARAPSAQSAPERSAGTAKLTLQASYSNSDALEFLFDAKRFDSARNPDETGSVPQR